MKTWLTSFFFCIPFLAFAQVSTDGTGVFLLSTDSSRKIIIRKEGEKLVADLPVFVRTFRDLVPTKDGKYELKDLGAKVIIEPGRTSSGDIRQWIVTDPGGKGIWQYKAPAPPLRREGRLSKGFGRIDSLRGELTPMRTCYDVTYYDIDITLQPKQRFVHGSNDIHFKTVAAFKRMQVDLYNEMNIYAITFEGKHLPYTRAFDAVFVDMPRELQVGEQAVLHIQFGGQPQVPNLAEPMNGGVLWYFDQNQASWSQAICQGSGASTWLPNKDHLSDEPDSVQIKITAPRNLQTISNGRMVAQHLVDSTLQQTTWRVTYPINNYNITFNLGDYAHQRDYFVQGEDSLSIDFYYLKSHEALAPITFNRIKPMLARYTEWFGPYPFPRDGFKLIESPHAMEHQSAVSIESLKTGDSSNLRNLVWHEVAHEWWGNNISIRDMADFWVHEAFASYAEVLSMQAELGTEAMLQYCRKEKPRNKQPIRGLYNVNHIHDDINDLYVKGALILHTFRSTLQNDTQFFALLRHLQQQFAYQTITGDMLIQAINAYVKKDYTQFFEQYIGYTRVPTLVYNIKNGVLSFKWEVDVPSYDYPVDVVAQGKKVRLHPTKEWQSIEMPGVKAKHLKVDTDWFYVQGRIE
ncbi:peptidase M1-like protein [Chitinophaga skermanii]|uniref:Peptidase M1-like protein n=1 Tax=Chitinophaga skermanii TaxID=331697 RepID=A0A327PZ96_9BACT|nr:M1 family metallopeptidase [Chitinophaga skermanii]RAI97565.1 peptidase M1-like protein [Chitinophaga skermanii]